jgi:hypothetical protein
MYLIFEWVDLLEWFFLCVGSHVQFQLSLAGSGVFTHSTGEWFVVSMHNLTVNL